jgi:5-methylcytosine-specific restriction enzyme subunit McrC
VVLARLILAQKTLVDQHGQIVGITFAVDMNKLFEKFMEKVVRDVARKVGFELDAQATRKLTEHVTMKPDLVLRKSGRDVAVGDVKYKALEPIEEDWSHPDLYQLLAYCTALRLQKGLLIYAEAAEHPSQKVHGADVVLEAVEVPLAGSRPVVLGRAEWAAARLVAHARERLAATQPETSASLDSLTASSL